MRYRKPSTHSDSLGQFFTPSAIASLLAASIRRAPDDLLELGAGSGALVAAMLDRYPETNATLVEVDPKLIRRLRANFGAQRIIRGDVLSGIDALKLEASYQTVIGNPPFGEFPLGQGDQAALRERFPGCDRGGWMRQDLAFLHESWTRVARGGELTMLLASPILCDPTFDGVRRWLLSDAGDVTVIELPENTFAGAEVGTYLLTIRHRGRSRRTKSVCIDRYLGGDRFQGKMRISVDAAIQRMDFRFHEIQAAVGDLWASAPSLASLGVHVVRGSRSHAQFEQRRVLHVHTTDFTDGGAQMRLGPHAEVGVQVAKCGDILVPRVGSRCLLREAMVVSGSRPITEAVYRIRVGKADRSRVFDAISGESGRQWRKAHARGSCAKHLTVSDLLGLPVLP